MTNFKPVSTMEDLMALDEAEIVAGYREAKIGDPEPGENRGRAYWHGWCNAMRDRGVLPPTPESWSLAREYLAWMRRN